MMFSNVVVEIVSFVIIRTLSGSFLSFHFDSNNFNICDSLKSVPTINFIFSNCSMIQIFLSDLTVLLANSSTDSMVVLPRLP